MSWNKRDYYYQNQMKVLSGTDAEPGYRESDGDSLTAAELNKRINGVSGDSTKPGNGLYKLVSLIKQKIDALWEAIFGAWRLHNEEREILNGSLNTRYKIGNYKCESGSINNMPEGAHSPFTLKISCVANDSSHRWQDFIEQSTGNRWYREGHGSGESWTWGPWMMVLSTSENPAEKKGTADDLFLKRKDDWTVGPTGFGIMPISGNQQQDVSQETRAKIVLGKYTYGTELPSVHYDSAHMNDSDIPKGQIYLQYDPQSSEG